MSFIAQKSVEMITLKQTLLDFLQLKSEALCQRVRQVTVGFVINTIT